MGASGSVSTDNPEDLPGEFIALDVTDEANVVSVMDQVADAHGHLNVLVNAAGIEIEATVEDTSLEQFIPEGVDPEVARAEAKAVHPLRTVGTPTDMANLVNWLASYEARYATGQLWVLDGGLSAQIQQMRF